MKVFKTIDEQIQILRQRGLIIDDIEKAKLYLLTQNKKNPAPCANRERDRVKFLGGT